MRKHIKRNFFWPSTLFPFCFDSLTWYRSDPSSGDPICISIGYFGSYITLLVLAARSSLTSCDRLMAAASSSSSSSALRCRYQVFINFRGEDTRTGFVSHLNKALRQKPINTFLDAEELRKGDRLSELLIAIRESRLSIVVFSQNYASSTWCLKELVEIMECHRTNEQIVLPIFYQVDPSDIRKHEGIFAEAFAKHGLRSDVDAKVVQSWRSALDKAVDFSGWPSQKDT